MRRPLPAAGSAAADKEATAVQTGASAKTSRGHQAPAASAPPDPQVLRLREHQSAAARQPYAEECRSLLRLSRYGVLSTLAVAPDTAGFPGGSIVGYADDEDTGAPIFAFSTMSGHTRDVMEDGRASLTVTAPGFQGAADARVNVMGVMRRVSDAERPAAVARYMAVHPDAYWVEFGDFSIWKMDELVAIRLVGGFARAGNVPPKLFAAARPDPVAGACGAQVAAANAAGAGGAWVAAVKRITGADVGLDSAHVLSLDRLGLNLAATRGKDAMKIRLPFSSPADTPEAVQREIDAMLS